jgi:hypothetical protein
MAKNESDKSGSKSPYMIKLVLLAVAVVVAVVLLWQMAGDEAPEEAPPAVEEETIPEMEPTPPAAPQPRPAAAEPVQTPAPAPLPDLAASDEVALAAAEDLSPDENLRDMLVSDDVILKSVRAVIGLADGNVVHEYRPIQSPDSPFLVEKLDEPPSETVGQRYRLSPRNYQRYDQYVAVLTALDPQNAAAVYQRFYPLLEEAYAQQGVNGPSFKEVTLDAIDVLLGAPVLEEEPILIQPKVFYQFEDPALEALPGPQKLLIRMGPENTRNVQATLRQLRDAIQAQPVPATQ